jgi:hypothetical protein
LANHENPRNHEHDLENTGYRRHGRFGWGGTTFASNNEVGHKRANQDQWNEPAYDLPLCERGGPEFLLFAFAPQDNAAETDQQNSRHEKAIGQYCDRASENGDGEEYESWHRRRIHVLSPNRYSTAEVR